MPATRREELLRSHKLAVRVKHSGAEHGVFDLDIRSGLSASDYYKDSGHWRRVVKPSVAEQICSGADDKAAVAPRAMQPPLPRPLRLSPNAGLVNGKNSMMHSGSAQSQSEPLLGPPQWQASKAASPRESSDAALSANHEAQPTSSNRGRPEEATADSEAPAPQPKPKKRVRWADEALNKPIAVCQTISSAHVEWFPQAYEQLCALLHKESEEANEALDMAVEQEGAHHAETPNVTPGTSSSLVHHGCTFNVPVTTEEMCPSEDFTAHATAMPSEGSSINIRSAAMGADKGDAHKCGMKIVVDITADCSSAATVPLITGADDKAAVAPKAMPILKTCQKVGGVDGKRSTMQREGTLLSGKPFLGPPQWQASKAASPRQELDGANLEAQPMSRKRGRPKEASEESTALALQPAPQKRVRWADDALPEPSLEVQTVSTGYAQRYPQDGFGDLCAWADEEMDPANEAWVMSAAQEAAQHAMDIPDNSFSLVEPSSTCTEPISEEQMCWCPSEDSSAYANATPGQGSSTATNSAAVSEDKDNADKGGIKTVVDIMADCSSAASCIINNREGGTSTDLHSPAMSGELAVELPSCLEVDLAPNCLAESQQAMFGEQGSGLPFFLGDELEPSSTVQSQPATSLCHRALFPEHLMATASHSALNQEDAPSLLTNHLVPAAQDLEPSATQIEPQRVHCTPARGHVKEETQRRARSTAGHGQGVTGSSSRLLKGVAHPKISKESHTKASLQLKGSAAASGQAAVRLSKADQRRCERLEYFVATATKEENHARKVNRDFSSVDLELAASCDQQRAQQPIPQAPTDPAMKRLKDAKEAVAPTNTQRQPHESTETKRHIKRSSVFARPNTGPNAAAPSFGCLHQSRHALTSLAATAPPTVAEPAERGSAEGQS